MQIVCPECGRSLSVVEDYKPGAIRACSCGAELKFVGPEKAPLVESDPGSHPASSLPPKAKTKEGKPG